MEADDLPLLFVEQPVVARDKRIVLVGLAVPLLPLEELATCDADPCDEAIGSDLGLRGPGADEVDDLVSRVMGNPATRQGSPSSFFKCTYSAEISAMTSSFLASRVLS